MPNLTMCDEEKDLLFDLTEVSTANPTLAALTIINLRHVIDDMENNKAHVAHADTVIERMRTVNMGNC